MQEFEQMRDMKWKIVNNEFSQSLWSKFDIILNNGVMGSAFVINLKRAVNLKSYAP